MKNRIFLPSVFALLILSACSQQKPAGGMHAAVQMRDGRTLTGSVLSSSVNEIKLDGDDHVTQTIPMAQVSSVQYDSPSAAQQTASAPTPSSTAPAPPQNAAPTPQTNQPVAAPIPAPTPAAPPVQAPAPEAAEPPHENHYHPPQEAITTKTFELAAGTQVSVRTEESIDSKKAVEGQTYAAEVTTNVRDANGAVVIPHGSNAQITIQSASKGKRFSGAADLVMDLSSISVDGQQYQVSTANLTQTGRKGLGANRRTGEYTGGGAAFGAIIGAIAGGGKGAAIGAGSGAGAGALTQIFTRGAIKVPAETVLTFKLDQPLQITAAR